MTDLVARLREGAPAHYSTEIKLRREAADEIERLRSENEQLRTALAEPTTKLGSAVNRWLIEQNERMRMLLRDRPRDDGTAVAVGGEPGASAGKSE